MANKYAEYNALATGVSEMTINRQIPHHTFSLVCGFAFLLSGIQGVQVARDSHLMGDEAIITIEGTLEYNAFWDNDSGSLVPVIGPIAGVTVAVLDEHSGGARLLGQVVTDDSGSFSITIINDEPDGIDPYLKWSVADEYSEIRDSTLFMYQVQTTLLGSNLNQNTYIGVNISLPNTFLAAQPFFILAEIRRAANYLEQHTLWVPDESVNVFTPRNCLGVPVDQIQSCYHGGIDLRNPDFYSRDVIIHEYGHHVHALHIGFFAVVNACAPTYNHTLFEPLAQTCAWTEGWADFFQMAVQNDPDYRGTNLEHVDVWIANMTDSPEKYEFIVAATLWDIFDINNETYSSGGSDQISDGFNGGHSQGLWYVVMELPAARQPKTLTAFWDEWFTVYEYQSDILCPTAYVFDHHQMKRSVKIYSIAVPPLAAMGSGRYCNVNGNSGVVGWQFFAYANPFPNYAVSGWQLSTGQTFGPLKQINFVLEDDVDIIASIVYSPWPKFFLPYLARSN